MATYQGLVKLGTLRRSGVIVPRPIKPWRTKTEEWPGLGLGDIADFSIDPDITHWIIGDTDSNEDNKLYWHKVEDNGKTLLICDRVILVNVSWDTLNSDNRVTGKIVTIDGQKYILRLLSGGNSLRNPSDSNSGANPTTNEWDRFIVNEAKVSGMPKPSGADYYDSTSADGRLSTHNQFWNWFAIQTIAQEKGAWVTTRGTRSALRFSTVGSSVAGDYLGWRPVLEVYNNVPTITLTNPANNQTLSEGSTYTIAGTASDPDAGNAVTVKYAINGGTARNITSAISDGASPIPFSKVLTFQNGRLYDGDTDVSGPLAENTTYTVSVWAVDDQGGTSPSYTRSCKVVLNRPPAINLDPYNANQTGLSELETLTFTGTVTDPDGDNVNLKVSFNGGAPQTLKSGAPSGTTFEYPVPVASLKSGTNTVVFTATDTKGAEKKKTLTFAKSGSFGPVKTAVVRYAITPPLGTTSEIVAWVHREVGDLTVAAAQSIVASDANETYADMTKNASVPVGDGGVIEDEFVGTSAQPGAKVTLRLTLTRADASSDQAVKKIMGGIG